MGDSGSKSPVTIASPTATSLRDDLDGSELSNLDGAFVIDGAGVIATCGAYLKTALQDEAEYSLPQGLGARHHAAAGITAVTDSIAITVSESTGTVTVFRDGRIVTEIEKPRHQRRREVDVVRYRFC